MELNSSLKISPTPAVPSIRKKKNVPSQTSAVFSPKPTHSSGPSLVHVWKLSFWPMYTTPNWTPLQKVELSAMVSVLSVSRIHVALTYFCLSIKGWDPLGSDSNKKLCPHNWNWCYHCLLALFLLLCKDEAHATPEDKAFKATSQNQNR